MELKTALLAGASGLVGNELLHKLLKSNIYRKVIVVGRSELELKHPKLQQIIVDFDNLKQYEDQLIADDIFCCLGTTMKKAGTRENFAKVDLHYPVALAESGYKKNARRYFLVSAMGADKKSFFFYNRVKGKVEEAVSKVGFDAVFIFRPSLILGERKEKREGEDFAKTLSGPLSLLMVGPLRKFRPIKASKIAESMTRVAHKDLKGWYIFESEEIKRIEA